MKGVRLIILEDKLLMRLKDSEMLVVDFDNETVFIHPDPFDRWLESNNIKDYKKDSYVLEIPGRNDWIGISIDFLIKTEKRPDIKDGLKKVKEIYLCDTKEEK